VILFFTTSLRIFKLLLKIIFFFALYRFEHDDNVNEFLIFAIMWEIFERHLFERHLFDCIKRVVETLCRLKNKFVKWSNSKARTRESFQNNERQKNFIEVVNKINETNIVLNIKSDDKYEKKHFFNRKKNTSSIYVLHVIVINVSFIFSVNDRIFNMINVYFSQKIFRKIRRFSFSHISIF
jgi:hypothetical protein